MVIDKQPPESWPGAGCPALSPYSRQYGSGRVGHETRTRGERAAFLRGDLTQVVTRDTCAKPEAGDAPSFAFHNIPTVTVRTVGFMVYVSSCMHAYDSYPPAGALCSKGSRASAQVALLAPEEN